ncbi:MAG: hypothetical protein OXT69_10370 [Candidatus Poribacteria bacterium]|nr:hypothetical protein [Candidatus Poribacteria bacterium]
MSFFGMEATSSGCGSQLCYLLPTENAWDGDPTVYIEEILLPLGEFDGGQAFRLQSFYAFTFNITYTE